MKFRYGTITGSMAFGFYATNWGYPIEHEWEIGLYLFKWTIGVEFFNDLD